MDAGDKTESAQQTLTEERDRYKRLYEESRAQVAELEKQNGQLKQVIQQLMEARHQRDTGAGPGAGAPDSASRAAPSNSQPPSAHSRGGRPTKQQASAPPPPPSPGKAQPSAAAAKVAAPAPAPAADPEKAPDVEEVDVRSEIVSMMRSAVMSKDAASLEKAIARAEAAGLSFEASQGRRQLGRIKQA